MVVPLKSVPPVSALPAHETRATPTWPLPACAGLRRERVCHAGLQLGKVQIMPPRTWDSAGWRCQVKVPHLLWSPLFACQIQARWQKGTVQYFNTVWKDEGSAMGEKRKGEVRRYPNLWLECATFNEWDVTGTQQRCWGLSTRCVPVSFCSWQQRGPRPDSYFSQLLLQYCLLQADLITGGCFPWDFNTKHSMVWASADMSYTFTQHIFRAFKERQTFVFSVLFSLRVLLQISFLSFFFFFHLTLVIRKIHFQHFYCLPGYLMKCNKETWMLLYWPAKHCQFWPFRNQVSQESPHWLMRFKAYFEAFWDFFLLSQHLSFTALTFLKFPFTKAR